MLNHYFPLVYFSCFVTVKEDETEKKNKQERSLKWTFVSFKNFWKKWTPGEFHSLKLFLSFSSVLITV